MKLTEEKGERVIVTDEEVTCPICGEWMHRHHFEKGGVRDDCDTCGFSGVNLSAGDFEALLKAIDHGND